MVGGRLMLMLLLVLSGHGGVGDVGGGGVGRRHLGDVFGVGE